jgi:cold shock CspA family protein
MATTPSSTEASTSTSTSTSTSSSTNAAANAAAKYTGRVKWFNNKFGYGFITVVSTDATASAAIGSDVFAHHSEIGVGEDQYRYLVQGEYVEFVVVKTASGNHEFQCSAIRGIHGGQLICETRHAAREQYKTARPPTADGGGGGGDRRFSGVQPSRGLSGDRGGRGGYGSGGRGSGAGAGYVRGGRGGRGGFSSA